MQRNLHKIYIWISQPNAEFAFIFYKGVLEIYNF